MHKYFFTSLRNRMIVLMAVGIIPPLLAAIGFASYQAGRIIQQQAQENLALRAETLADSVNRWDAMNTLALRALSENTAFAEMNPEKQLAVLSAQYRTYPEIYGTAVTDTEGNNFASGSFFDKVRNYKNRIWFRGAMEGNAITRQTIISKTYNKPAVALSMPVRRYTDLKPGDRGAAVATLQKYLKEHNYYSAEASGHYDEATQTAVADFQRSQGLPVTGTADALSRYIISGEKTTQAPPFKEEEPGEIVGVITLAAFLTDLGRTVGAVKLGQTGFAFLVDDKGKVLAHPNKNFVSGKELTDFSENPAVKRLLAGEAGLLAFTDKGGKWLSYGAHLPNGWGVIALQQEAEVLEKKRWFWQLALIVAVVAVTVVFGLTFLLANSLTKPVVELTGAAVTVGKGDWNYQMDIDRGDEIGVLADTFNQMSKQLRISFSVLEEKREEAFKAREQAIEASKMKSAFVANMTHELRTPLNAIIGYSEMLQEDMLEEDMQEFVPDLKKIGIAGRHLLALVNDVLDFSKVEAGRMELHLETFPLCTIVNEMTQTMQLLVEKNNNRLIVDCPSEIGEVHADMTKARQCLFNLASNANKFTEHGSIHVTAKRFEKDGEDWVSIAVKDSGIGITREQLSKLFNAFSQADSSTTRKYGGTGLGLVISRQFCRMMGGDIEVASVFGEGSTFTMLLPVEAKPQMLGETGEFVPLGPKPVQ